MSEPEKKVLYLSIMRGFFSEILSGEKKVDYREATPYWTSRIEGRDFDEVKFRNGYRKDSPTMRVEVMNIRKAAGWYHIRLGRILECTIMDGV